MTMSWVVESVALHCGLDFCGLICPVLGFMFCVLVRSLTKVLKTKLNEKKIIIYNLTIHRLYLLYDLFSMYTLKFFIKIYRGKEKLFFLKKITRQSIKETKKENYFPRGRRYKDKMLQLK